MLAILYLIIAIFFGTQLIRFLIPDIRRLYVGIASEPETIEKVPTMLFLLPAGTLVGLLLTSWVTYFLAYIMHPYIPADTANLLPANIVSMCIFAYLACLFWQRCFLRNYRNLQNPSFRKLPDFRRHPGSVIFYLTSILLVISAVSFVYFYTCFTSGNSIRLGFSIFSDFSPHVAITSGFGIGSNFPTQYPHFAGDNIQYHFMFYFLTGNLEAMGLPLVWAINLPSILCMGSALSLLGTLAVLLSARRGAFFFAPLLVLFRSAWNVFHQFAELKDAPGATFSSAIKTITKQSAWYGYTFRDEWGIWAINVYANQRHLAMGVGLVLVFIFLFLPHFRRMFLHLSRTKGAGKKLKMFFASREAWIGRKSDPLHPWGSVILGSAIALAMPFFHGSCLICALLVLFGMAIFSEFRLGYAVVAAVSVLSATVQAWFFAGGASNVASFQYNFGYVIPELAGKEKAGIATVFASLGTIGKYLVKIGFLTIILSALLFVGLLIYELVRKKNPYRPVLLVCFAFPMVFAFFCQISLEVLANHKFIQVSFILFDIFVAGLLANLLALPLRLAKKTEDGDAKSSKFAMPKKAFIPTQIASAAICLCLTFGLTATGISEWYTYYNINTHEGGFVELNPDAQIVDWVCKNTAEDDIFLTPMWSVNDFFLSGRRVYYGWPYFAWSAGHDTATRQINYQWLLCGCNDNIDEFRRYCNEVGIRYVILSDDYYGNTETSDYYYPEFFENNLTEMVRFDDGTAIYKV
ncbi:MAG: hypothetical protein IKH92_05845 [Clostridiales bacterium]|nr:hypothetical protein [Clostridiales bacterium]